MSFGDYKYQIDVKGARSQDGHSQESQIGTGVYTFVYEAGTKTLATLYSDKARTALANPIARSTFDSVGLIEFYTANTSVDIFVADDLGNVGRYAGLTYSDHSLRLQTDGVAKCLIAPFGASDATEVDTGLDFPLDVHIRDVLIEVGTADATETLDVGLLSSETNGDANGLLSLAPVASTGIIKPWAVTVGGTETYVSATYYGALMGPGIAGANTATDHGIGAVPGHIVTGSNAVSLTYTGSSGSDTAAGYIYAYFNHLR